MVYSLVKRNSTDTFVVEKNLILETTRLFLSKNHHFSKISFINKRLYFENNLLLENVSKYEVSTIEKISTINICIYNNSICQVWKIKE